LRAWSSFNRDFTVTSLRRTSSTWDVGKLFENIGMVNVDQVSQKQRKNGEKIRETHLGINVFILPFYRFAQLCVVKMRIEHLRGLNVSIVLHSIALSESL
jgi:hypothetical protein